MDDWLKSDKKTVTYGKKLSTLSKQTNNAEKLYGLLGSKNLDNKLSLINDENPFAYDPEHITSSSSNRERNVLRDHVENISNVKRKNGQPTIFYNDSKDFKKYKTQTQSNEVKNSRSALDLLEYQENLSKFNLKDWIKNGHKDDLKFLRDVLVHHNKLCKNNSNQKLCAEIIEDAEESSNRLIKWLLAIGFEKVKSDDECILFYTLSFNDIFLELKKLLLDKNLVEEKYQITNCENTSANIMSESSTYHSLDGFSSLQDASHFNWNNVYNDDEVETINEINSVAYETINENMQQQQGSLGAPPSQSGLLYSQFPSRMLHDDEDLDAHAMERLRNRSRSSSSSNSRNSNNSRSSHGQGPSPFAFRPQTSSPFLSIDTEQLILRNPPNPTTSASPCTLLTSSLEAQMQLNSTEKDRPQPATAQREAITSPLFMQSGPPLAVPRFLSSSMSMAGTDLLSPCHPIAETSFERHSLCSSNNDLMAVEESDSEDMPQQDAPLSPPARSRGIELAVDGIQHIEAHSDVSTILDSSFEDHDLSAASASSAPASHVKAASDGSSFSSSPPFMRKPYANGPSISFALNSSTTSSAASDTAESVSPKDASSNSFSCFSPLMTAFSTRLSTESSNSDASSRIPVFNIGTKLQHHSRAAFSPPLFTSIRRGRDSGEAQSGFKRQLRRSISMPARPSGALTAGSSCSDGQATPGSHKLSMSQPTTVSEYRTPQSLRCIRISGHCKMDWGVSQPAGATSIQLLCQILHASGHWTSSPTTATATAATAPVLKVIRSKSLDSVQPEPAAEAAAPLPPASPPMDDRPTFALQPALHLANRLGTDLDFALSSPKACPPLTGLDFQRLPDSGHQPQPQPPQLLASARLSLTQRLHSGEGPAASLTTANSPAAPPATVTTRERRERSASFAQCFLMSPQPDTTMTMISELPPRSEATQQSMPTISTMEGGALAFNHLTSPPPLLPFGSQPPPPSLLSNLDRPITLSKWSPSEIEVMKFSKNAKLRRVSFQPTAAQAEMSPRTAGGTASGPPTAAELRAGQAAAASALLRTAMARRRRSLLREARNSRRFSESHSLNYAANSRTERSFRHIIIGGSYLQSFQSGLPVVCPPSSADVRVVGAVIANDGTLTLTLSLITPAQLVVSSPAVVVLRSDWQCLRASPDGYLVGDCDLEDSSQPPVYYYLPKHPADWDWLRLQAAGYPEPAAPDAAWPQPQPLRRRSRDADLMLTDAVADEVERDEGINRRISHSEALRLPRQNWDAVLLSELVLDFLVAAEPASPACNGRQRRLKQQPQAAQPPPSDTSAWLCISKNWSMGFYKLKAHRLSNGRCQLLDRDGWQRFLQRHPLRRHLSGGACKEVYCVRGATGGSEALSCMDMKDLHDREMDWMVAREIETSLACSALHTLNICPNVVAVYSLFQSEYLLPPVAWQEPASAPGRGKMAIDSAATLKRPKKSGLYQYIRMEFCAGGDLETLVRRAPDQQLEVSVVRSMLFQMCYSLYCARDKLALRHFDVKLLNFFVCKGEALLQDDPCAQLSHSPMVELRVGLGQHVYFVPLRRDGLELVKLADFGTSEMGLSGLCQPVTVNQFTTLENTPPEYLILGSGARQCYSGDCFCLGLAFLHLLTGREPYEELLRDVRCPEYLRCRLHDLWTAAGSDSPYSVVRQVMSSLDTPNGGPGLSVLYDTLYRYFVLFGTLLHHSEFQLSSCMHAGYDEQWGGGSDLGGPYAESPVWQMAMEALGLDQNGHCSAGAEKDKRLGRRAARQQLADPKAACRAQFERDRAFWAVKAGSHEVMVSVRSRLQALGADAESLFARMVHIDPSRRCTMYEALTCPVFASYRRSQFSDPLSQPVVSFMHYYNNNHVSLL